MEHIFVWTFDNVIAFILVAIVLITYLILGLLHLLDRFIIKKNKRKKQ